MDLRTIDLTKVVVKTLEKIVRKSSHEQTYIEGNNSKEARFSNIIEDLGLLENVELTTR